METQTLRDLARDYAKGALNRDSYRRNRSALIDGILAGTIRVEAIEFAPPTVDSRTGDTTGPVKRRRRPPPSVLDDTDALDVFDVTQVVPESGAERTPPRPERAPVSAQTATGGANSPAGAAASNYALFVVGAVAIVAIIGLVIAVVSRNDAARSTAPVSTAAAPVSEPALPDAGVAGEIPQVTPSPGEPTAATDAVVDFLGKRNWSDSSMNEFLTVWQSLPQSERDAAAGSGEMLQMANAIYKKLLEVRGLAQVTDAATLQQKQDRLYSFARNLGINDSRLAPQPAGNNSSSN